MCVSLSKRIGSYLFKSDIEKLSDSDLQIIDQLWARYSKRRFGFSVQKEIYDSVEGDYVQFCAIVGWPTYNSHSANSDYHFSLKAPIGHLPTRISMGGCQWWRHANTFAIKLDQFVSGSRS